MFNIQWTIHIIYKSFLGNRWNFNGIVQQICVIFNLPNCFLGHNVMKQVPPIIVKIHDFGQTVNDLSYLP